MGSVSVVMAGFFDNFDAWVLGQGHPVEVLKVFPVELVLYSPDGALLVFLVMFS